MSVERAGFAFVCLLHDRDDAIGLSRLLEDVRLPNAEAEATFLVPPVPGLAFFADQSRQDELDEWWGQNIPPNDLPVYLTNHEDGLPEWMQGVDGLLYVGVPTPAVAALYGTSKLVTTFKSTSPLDFATVVMRDFSRASEHTAVLFDSGEALRMAALSADFPMNMEDGGFGPVPAPGYVPAPPPAQNPAGDGSDGGQGLIIPPGGVGEPDAGAGYGAGYGEQSPATFSSPATIQGAPALRPRPATAPAASAHPFDLLAAPPAQQAQTSGERHHPAPPDLLSLGGQAPAWPPPETLAPPGGQPPTQPGSSQGPFGGGASAPDPFSNAPAPPRSGNSADPAEGWFLPGSTVGGPHPTPAAAARHAAQPVPSAPAEDTRTKKAKSSRFSLPISLGWPRRPGKRDFVETPIREFARIMMERGPTIVVMGSRKGGVGKTSYAAGVAIVAGTVLDTVGHKAAIVDANIANPDAWGQLNLREGAATAREVVAALTNNREPPPPVHATTPALACYPESRETTEYSKTDIQRFADYLRRRYTFIVVDMSNRLPDPLAGPEAAAAAYWLEYADVLVLPTTSSKQDFNGVLDYLDVRDLPPTVVPYIVPTVKKNREHPVTQQYLYVIRERVHRIVEIPDEADSVRYAGMEGVPVEQVSNSLRSAYRELTEVIARVPPRART